MSIATRFRPAGSWATMDYLYHTPGEHDFIVPAGVRMINVCLIGAGAGGSATEDNNSWGGSSGALNYKNNIPVYPGQRIRLKVGAGSRGDGEDSWFQDPTYLRAGGGQADGGPGGTRTGGDGGGDGGQGGSPTSSRGGGGAGAGGYNGAGGTGGGGSGTNGSAGGGGRSDDDGSPEAGGGGGVKPYGQGSSGAGGSQGVGGSPGSGGSPGGNGSSSRGGGGGEYGGGGGGVDDGTGGYGARGCVRIMWQSGAAFPSTNVALIASPTYSLTV